MLRCKYCGREISVRDVEALATRYVGGAPPSLRMLKEELVDETSPDEGSQN